MKERMIMEKTRPQGQQDLLEIFRGRGGSYLKGKRTDTFKIQCEIMQ